MYKFFRCFAIIGVFPIVFAENLLSDIQSEKGIKNPGYRPGFLCYFFQLLQIDHLLYIVVYMSVCFQIPRLKPIEIDSGRQIRSIKFNGLPSRIHEFLIKDRRHDLPQDINDLKLYD